MLIYEVNLEVDEAVNFRCAGWLPERIQKMLEFKGFKTAYWYFRRPEDEGRESGGKTLWTIHYVVENRPSLDEYFAQHKAQLQQEMTERFGDSFACSERVLQILSVVGFPEDSQ
jgi:hypothetical protein